MHGLCRYADLLRRGWARDPSSRPTAVEMRDTLILMRRRWSANRTLQLGQFVANEQVRCSFDNHIINNNNNCSSFISPLPIACRTRVHTATRTHTHTHTHIHTRARARAHARTHARTHVAYLTSRVSHCAPLSFLTSLVCFASLVCFTSLACRYL
jgi:hypothetical protein